MLRSMTGFGRFIADNEICSQQWEIKSVNGRHLEIKWKLPAQARYLEPALEKIARRYASRGRIEITLVMQFSAQALPTALFDANRANAMLGSLQKLAISRNEPFTPDYSALLRLPDLWGESVAEINAELEEWIKDGLEQALADWNDARAKEGAILAVDLQTRIIRMEEWTELILTMAPEIRAERLNNIRARLQEALSETELEEQRFLQEIVILSDKIDVTEELTRLGAHLERLRELLLTGEDAGRRLDFTLQECFREINTCGNKLVDSQVSRIVVDYKNELEKCREQAMNLE